MAASTQQNRLVDESSAYLRQHMDNPVAWLPWGVAALERAQREDKPLLVSIGYSACHWCHVMAHESFEDAETAALMNELFVNIKVDREERPDVDQLYMDALVRMTGHGGWPLTAFCLPDGRPFYTGTYFPDERRHNTPAFREVLHAVNDAYRNRRGEVEDTAAQVLQALAKRPEGDATSPPSSATLTAAAREVMQTADTRNGGFGAAPKFPTPSNLEMLLAAARLPELPRAEADAIVAHCRLSAREMARRGLFDHLGGGFHRYCVDTNWGIPHFEKMLYDQGMLLRFYADLYPLYDPRTRDRELAWVMRETVRYLQREMNAGDGGFYASQDADSEGAEGKFFVWTPHEIESALGPAAAAFCAAYGVSEGGNFEAHTTHLADHARGLREVFAAERATLYQARARRVAPETDRKRVCAWNGYAISGLVRASIALDEAEWLELARETADFVLTKLRDRAGRLQRVYNEGRASVHAFLDDHAAMLEACLDLARAGAGDRYLAEAGHLGTAIAQHFYDAEEGDLFLAPADTSTLVQRPRSDHDGATPHATGQATIALLRLALLQEDTLSRDISERVLQTHAYVLERAPQAYPTLARAAALAERGGRVAVIAGEPHASDTQALAKRAREVLAPEDGVIVFDPAGTAPAVAASWLAGRGLVEGTAAAYLCQGTTCSLPFTDAADFETHLSDFTS